MPLVPGTLAAYEDGSWYSTMDTRRGILLGIRGRIVGATGRPPEAPSLPHFGTGSSASAWPMGQWPMLWSYWNPWEFPSVLGPSLHRPFSVISERRGTAPSCSAPDPNSSTDPSTEVQEMPPPYPPPMRLWQGPATSRRWALKSGPAEAGCFKPGLGK